MLQFQLHLVQNTVDQLVSMVPSEQRSAAEALKAVLLNTLTQGRSTAVDKPKPAGRAPMGVTIQVGAYGYVICATQDEAAALLGMKSTSLGVSISKGGGKHTVQKPDPNNGSRVELTIQRGIHGEETDGVREILIRLPARGGAAKVAKQKKDKAEQTELARLIKEAKARGEIFNVLKWRDEKNPRDLNSWS